MSTSPARRLVALLLAVVGGFATTGAFPDYGLWPLSFVGIGLLFLALRGQGAVFSWFLGTAFGAAFFLPLISWTDYVVGPVPWVALSVVEAALVGVACVAWSFAQRSRVLRSAVLAPLVFAVVWTAGEVLRSSWPFGGFPWGRLAFAHADSPLGRLAWLGGPTLVSFAVAVVGVVVGLALWRLTRLQVGHAAGAVIVASLVLVSGLFVPLNTQAEEGRLAVGIVQGNVAEPGLGAFANRREVLNNHLTGTYALLDTTAPGSLDLVLWPENASDVDPRVDADAAQQIDAAAAAVDAPILVGTQRYADGGRYNEGVLWEPGQGITDVYAKQHPVPFAEYVPLRNLARRFSSAVDLVTTDMLAGEGAGHLALDSKRLGRVVGIGDVICFEVAYDDVVHGAIKAGGELLVVQTNNANFGMTAESTQQLAMARIRAIETGRATVQVSTVGVSAVIDPAGRVLQETELFTPAQMIADLPLRSSLTPAVRAGAVPSWIVSVLAGAAAIVGATRRRPTA